MGKLWREYRPVVVVAVGVLLFACIALGLYWHTFSSHVISDEPDRWGQFGDYVGGVLNPVFGFATVLILLYTIVLQRRELKNSALQLELSRHELRASTEALRDQGASLRQQNFEQVFFSLLNLYMQHVDHFAIPGRPHQGRDATES